MNNNYNSNKNNDKSTNNDNNNITSLILVNVFFHCAWTYLN